MAFYVNVPKDLSKVKNKVAFNLTKRQIICFGIAAAVGFPFYFLTRGLIGNSNAATAMVMLMIPAFVFAMYERDGMPLEKVLGNYIRVKYLKPQIRRYETTNISNTDEGDGIAIEKLTGFEGGATARNSSPEKGGRRRGKGQRKQM